MVSAGNERAALANNATVTRDAQVPVLDRADRNRSRTATFRFKKCRSSRLKREFEPENGAKNGKSAVSQYLRSGSAEAAFSFVNIWSLMTERLGSSLPARKSSMASKR